MSRARPPDSPDERDPAQLDLAALDDKFAAADVPTPCRPIPDGSYRVEVVDVKLTTTRTTDRPILKWKLRIVGPGTAYQGRLLWKNSGLRTAQNLRWLKHDLRVAGLALAKLSELPMVLGHLVDIELDVTKRTRNGYDDIYFNRRLDGTPGRDPGVPF
jgi:hypothetical protein